MAEIDLSIIILSYNTKDLLRQCLNSITQTLPPNTELIVVDNNSRDGSQEMVKEYLPCRQAGKILNAGYSIQLIENKDNLGYAKGNNTGLKHAHGKYILFLNSDTEVFKGALEEAVEFMEKNPDVGALSAKTLLVSGKMDPDCHRGFPTPWASLTYFFGLEKLFPKSRIFGHYHKFYLDLNKNHEIDAGAGAFMVIPREIIDQVGIWDESYFFYGEDLDFFYRIKKAGYKVVFYARPLLKHYKGASSGLRKESKSIAKNSRENRIKVAKASVVAMEIFYRKFYQVQYPFWLTFIVLLAIKIKGQFRIIKHLLS